MIIKVKKRDLLILSGVLILIILIPYIYSADDVAARKAGFGVWVVISNQNPTNITINNVTGQNFDPKTSDVQGIVISFNVSDPDGLGNVNGSDGNARVVVNFTLGSPDIAQFRTGGSCTNVTNDDDTSPDKVTFTCTVNMKYYDNSSNAWVANITVYDSNSGSGYSNGTFTYNALSGFLIIARDVNEGANINFSGANVGQSDLLAKAPLLLNNTGNDDFDQINITGAALLEQGGGSGSIAITSFYVNVTNNTVGQGLQLSAAPQIIPATTNIGGSGGTNPNATLMHGPSSEGANPYPGVANSNSKGNQTLIFIVDVPTGLSAATYNNTWNMTVVDID